MATVNPVWNRNVSAYGSADIVTWVLTTADSDGAPVELPEHADLCWHAYGTWGGATLTIEGSNATAGGYAAISNAAGGTACTFTANGIKQTIEAPRFKRPNLTTPGSGASVTVVLLIRRNTPMRT